MLSIQDLSFSYTPNQLLLEDICLNVHRGRYLFLSKTGEGKTTFLKLLCGLLPTHQVHAPQPIAMTFQQNALFDSLSVKENLTFVAHSLKIDPAPIDTILDSVGLLEHADKSPIDISGGMRKRLGIARTFLLDYPFEIYDDPTAGLDPVTSKQILKLIEARKGDKLIIVASHEIKAVIDWVDGVLLLQNKKVKLIQPRYYQGMLEEFY